MLYLIIDGDANSFLTLGEHVVYFVKAVIDRYRTNQEQCTSSASRVTTDYDLAKYAQYAVSGYTVLYGASPLLSLTVPSP